MHLRHTRFLMCPNLGALKKRLAPQIRGSLWLSNGSQCRLGAAVCSGGSGYGTGLGDCAAASYSCWHIISGMRVLFPAHTRELLSSYQESRGSLIDVELPHVDTHNVHLTLTPQRFLRTLSGLHSAVVYSKEFLGQLAGITVSHIEGAYLTMPGSCHSV